MEEKGGLARQRKEKKGQRGGPDHFLIVVERANESQKERGRDKWWADPRFSNISAKQRSGLLRGKGGRERESRPGRSFSPDFSTTRAEKEEKEEVSCSRAGRTSVNAARETNGLIKKKKGEEVKGEGVLFIFIP